MSKASRKAYDSGDFQSVTFHEAQDRLAAVCGVEFSSEQLRDLKNLRDRRNKIEHFGAVDSLPAVQASTSKMVSFLIDFAERAFNRDDLEQENSLLAEVRSKLGNCHAVVKQRWLEIQTDVDRQFSMIECPACEQNALGAADNKVKYLFCFYSANSETAAQEYVANIVGLPSRFSHRNDGVDWPVRNRPSCDADTLVTNVPGQDDAEKCFCFACGATFLTDQLKECHGCGELYVCSRADENRNCRRCFPTWDA